MKILGSFILMILLCGSSLALAEGTKKDQRTVPGTGMMADEEQYQSVVLEFEKNSHILGKDQIKKMREALKSAAQSGEIEKVEIAVWSDKAHPQEKTDLPQADKELAENRIKVVENYLEAESEKIDDIDTYNMAERAHWLAQLFNTDEAELDAVFAKQGKEPLKRKNFELIKKDGAPSKAVLVFEIEKK